MNSKTSQELRKLYTAALGATAKEGQRVTVLFGPDTPPLLATVTRVAPASVHVLGDGWREMIPHKEWAARTSHPVTNERRCRPPCERGSETVIGRDEQSSHPHLAENPPLLRHVLVQWDSSATAPPPCAPGKSETCKKTKKHRASRCTEACDDEGDEDHRGNAFVKERRPASMKNTPRGAALCWPPLEPLSPSKDLPPPEEFDGCLQMKNPNMRSRSAQDWRSHLGSKAQAKNFSGFRHVFKAGKDSWQVRVSYHAKKYYVGCFDNAEVAARAADRKSVQLGMERYEINFPEDYDRHVQVINKASSLPDFSEFKVKGGDCGDLALATAVHRVATPPLELEVADDDFVEKCKQRESLYRPNKHGYRGVVGSSYTGRYFAVVYFNAKEHISKSFGTAEEAAMAYDALAVAVGKAAAVPECLNFRDEWADEQIFGPLLKRSCKGNQELRQPPVGAQSAGDPEGERASTHTDPGVSPPNDTRRSGRRAAFKGNYRNLQKYPSPPHDIDDDFDSPFLFDKIGRAKARIRSMTKTFALFLEASIDCGDRNYSNLQKYPSPPYDSNKAKQDGATEAEKAAAEKARESMSASSRLGNVHKKAKQDGATEAEKAAAEKVREKLHLPCKRKDNHHPESNVAIKEKQELGQFFQQQQQQQQQQLKRLKAIPEVEFKEGDSVTFKYSFGSKTSDIVGEVLSITRPLISVKVTIKGYGRAKEGAIYRAYPSELKKTA